MITQRFHEEFQKELKAKLYAPAQPLSEKWYDAAINALSNASPAQLGVSVEDVQEIYFALDRRKQLTLMQFAVANNALENMSSKALGMENRWDDYFDIQKEVNNQAMHWTQATNHIRQDVQRRINEEEKMKEAASHTDKAPFLKPVVGEA